MTVDSPLAPSEQAEKIQSRMRKEEEIFILKQRYKACIEALLFSTDMPLRFQKLKEILDSIHPIKPRELQQFIAELQYEYHSQKRGFVLEEIAEGFILRTSQDFSPQLTLLHESKRIEKLSHASTEVLAIIAYKQPLTRAGVEAIRGVDSTGAIHNILERDLIEPVGKQQSPGRPTLYGTTPYFLQYFGLKDLSELQQIFLPKQLESSDEKPEVDEVVEENQEKALDQQLQDPPTEEIALEEESDGLELAIDLEQS